MVKNEDFPNFIKTVNKKWMKKYNQPKIMIIGKKDMDALMKDIKPKVQNQQPPSKMRGDDIKPVKSTKSTILKAPSLTNKLKNLINMGRFINAFPGRSILPYELLKVED